jgi:hypothetical protein
LAEGRRLKLAPDAGDQDAAPELKRRESAKMKKMPDE